MAYNLEMTVKNLLTLVPLSMLVACGWVDSTGRESNSAPVVQINFFDNQQTDAIELNEEGELSLAVNATDTDGEVNRYQWRQAPVEQGALDQCAIFPDFDMELAAETLDVACTPTANCVVNFEQKTDVDGSDEVEFLVNTPKLRAPVGVTYQLDAIDNEGGTGSQRSTFCLIAINEAPDAVDDVFTVLEGQVLSVKADAGQVNLLTNDVPDDHVSNMDLVVLTTPETGPSFAQSFVLESNGGFTYSSSLIADRGLERVVDSFVYSVTDGTQVASATVTVNVVAENDAPEQVAPIPLQLVTADVAFESDLSTFFTDAEGGMLSFTVSGGALPASGALSLSADGVLSGRALQIDVGNYAIEIIASDGSEKTTAIVELAVVGNLPVEADFILAQSNSLGDVFELDISEFFTDPEGAPLKYTAARLGNTATINLDEDTGELEALFTETGNYTIDVFADDGVTMPASIRFVVIVSTDNVAPVFRGSIANRNFRVGFAITPIVGIFSDANGDELTYRVVGVLPEGLALSPTGVLYGIPTEDGIFTGIRLIASDPLGRFARSNAFTIRVRAVVTIPVVTPPVVTPPVIAPPATPPVVSGSSR